MGSRRPTRSLARDGVSHPEPCVLHAAHPPVTPRCKQIRTRPAGWLVGWLQVGHAVIGVEGRRGSDKLLVLLELYRTLTVRVDGCECSMLAAFACTAQMLHSPPALVRAPNAHTRMHAGCRWGGRWSGHGGAVCIEVIARAAARCAHARTHACACRSCCPSWTRCWAASRMRAAPRWRMRRMCWESRWAAPHALCGTSMLRWVPLPLPPSPSTHACMHTHACVHMPGQKLRLYAWLASGAFAAHRPLGARHGLHRVHGGWQGVVRSESVMLHGHTVLSCAALRRACAALWLAGCSRLGARAASSACWTARCTPCVRPRWHSSRYIGVGAGGRGERGGTGPAGGNWVPCGGSGCSFREALL